MSNCQATGAANHRLIMARGTGAAAFNGIPTGRRLFPISTGLVVEETLRESEALRANAARFDSDMIPDVINVAGPVVIEPTLTDLPWVIPLLTGATLVSNEAAMTDVLLAHRFYSQVGDTYMDYRDVVCSGWTLSAVQGQSLRITLNLIGKTATEGDATAFNTALGQCSAASNLRGISLHEGAITLNGTARQFSDIEISCDRQVSPGFYNSKTAQCLDIDGKRQTTFRLSIPRNSTNKDVWKSGHDAVPAVLSFVVDVSNEFAIELTGLQWNKTLPAVNGAGKVFDVFEGDVVAKTGGLAYEALFSYIQS